MVRKYRKLTLEIVEIARRKKCHNITVLDLVKLTPLCDYFIILTVNSKPQMNAVYIEIKKFANDKLTRFAYREDPSPAWKVLDYGNIIVNIMMPEAREFYALERVWYKAKKLKLHD